MISSYERLMYFDMKLTKMEITRFNNIFAYFWGYLPPSGFFYISIYSIEMRRNHRRNRRRDFLPITSTEGCDWRFGYHWRTVPTFSFRGIPTGGFKVGFRN